MKIPDKYSFEYVNCLPQKLEVLIMTKIVKSVSNLPLNQKEKVQAVENANGSKLCDLEDTIKIKYV